MKKASHTCTVDSISVFGRFSVDDWRKEIKYDALSNENALVWTGERLENASLVEKLFVLCFLQNESGDF